MSQVSQDPGQMQGQADSQRRLLSHTEGWGMQVPPYCAELAVTRQFQIFAIPCRCQKLHTDIPTDSPHTELSDLSNLLFLREGYVLQTSAVYFQPKGSTVGLASIKGLKCCSQLLSLTPKTSQSCLISVSSVQICEKEKITTPWVSCYGMYPADLLWQALPRGLSPCQVTDLTRGVPEWIMCPSSAKFGMLCLNWP